MAGGAGGGAPVRSPFSVARKAPTPDDESSSEADVSVEPTVPASKRESAVRNRRRSHAERGRDPSYSYNRRREARKRDREEGGKTHRRRRRTHHRSRRHRSATPDKRRRSESSKRDAARKKARSSMARPPSPKAGPASSGTKKCPHCWAEVTVQPSGRAQHQWSNRTCLMWQCYNDMDKKLKQTDDALAWKKAKDAAAILYERRRFLSAPHPTEASVPPVVLRSRASAKTSVAPEEDMEVVSVEEEPEVPQQHRKLGQTVPKAAPAAAPSGSTGSSGKGQGPPVPEAATAPSSGQKQQIVINISSS